MKRILRPSSNWPLFNPRSLNATTYPTLSHIRLLRDRRSPSDVRQARTTARESTTSGNRRRRPDGSNIPFNDGMVIPTSVLETSTITPRERDIFHNLFQEAIQKAEQEALEAEKATLEDGERDREKASLLASNALSNVERFPAALRDIAKSAAQSVEFYKYQAASRRGGLDTSQETIIESEQLTRQIELKALQQEESARIEQSLRQAKSDVALWAVLEEELFEKIAKLQLDSPILAQVFPTIKVEGKPELNAKKIALAAAIVENVAPEDAEKLPNLVKAKKASDEFAVLRPIYPTLLVIAAKVFWENFPNSGHVFAILPRVREIGEASFALGASTALYNEILAATWANMNTFHEICDILAEMDKSGFEFDNDTFALIRKMRRDWNVWNHKNITALERAATKLDLMQSAFSNLTFWRKTIEERLEAEALRKANQQINDKLSTLT
ncbi:hypothetical protein BT63DRAFT_417857 [Microthyrium microscopicum]|uniref:Mtf2-like C-terminal domain-containing protein n=1 Tax=Microthyrium microscopicum TaxID=703497 RepID=A0A6A6TYJ6_9PEZI|nr:hypothetical protein BT63DRAFT_417857 [Microthyrium microscopicum]